MLTKRFILGGSAALTAAATAFAAAVLTGGPASATPAAKHAVERVTAHSSVASAFAVLRRAPTAEDAVPGDPTQSPLMRDLKVDEARLAYNRDGARVWLIPKGENDICVMTKTPDTGSMGCTALEAATNLDTPMVDFAGSGLVVLLPDTAASATFSRLDGSTVTARNESNLAFVDDATNPAAVTVYATDGQAHEWRVPVVPPRTDVRSPTTVR